MCFSGEANQKKYLSTNTSLIMKSWRQITGKPVTKVLTKGGLGSKEYLETLTKFYAILGYDYVPLEVPLKLLRKNTLQARDAAYLSRGMRTREDEGRSTIETDEDFDDYPWPDPEEAADLSAFETLAKVLPRGTGVVGGVAGGVFEHVSWLMSLGKLCRAVHLDKKLVERVFRKVGSLILSVDAMIVNDGYVDALRMSDDLGYKTSTFLPPRFIREHVLPYYEVLVDLAHRKGLPFIIHSCGNLYVPDDTGRSIMDDLVEYVRMMPSTLSRTR